MSEYTYAIGLMSGTSLDGLDLVYVKFNNKNSSDFQILFAETIAYEVVWQRKLQNAILFSSDELKELNNSYGKLLGDLCLHFIIKNKIRLIDFIASHGHTVLHQPDKGITLQVGCGKEIAKITKCKVIYDFRTQDVALGGQGAPLVPIGDELLFGAYDYCVNLGGFANVSYRENAKRIAFDICPVNIVLNHYTRKIGLDYDKGGSLASKGKIHKGLLGALNQLEFYAELAPKSLGLEWVKEKVIPMIDNYDLEVSDVLRTVIEHSAYQISKIVKSDNVLFTGGGVFNTFLMERIQGLMKENVKISSDLLINYKEALIFAFLGLRRNANEINCLKSVTGAKMNHSSGKIYHP